MRYIDAEKAVWKRLIRDDDDLLRGFYLAVRADVTDLIAMKSRSSSLQSGDTVDSHVAGLTSLLAFIGEDFDETFSGKECFYITQRPAFSFRTGCKDSRPSKASVLIM